MSYTLHEIISRAIQRLQDTLATDADDAETAYNASQIAGELIDQIDTSESERKCST